jgi:alkylation response protein AidB-like acyl-CoA dehydrogenase
MDLRLSAEQTQLVDSVGALLARHSSPEQVRAAEATGFDPVLWDRLQRIGAVEMATAGASLLDLALVAERLGRWVAAAPLVEAQVAARLLDRLGVPAPDGIVTLALHPALDGVARLVPAGAVADHALLRVGDRLVLAPLDGHRTAVVNLGSMPLADVTVPSTAVEVGPGDAVEGAVDEWLALTAAALVGVGARALEIGVEYVKERHAWGVPIGSFQSVAHRLADAAAALDGANLLAREAAWAADDEPARFGELAAMAFAFCGGAARDATYRSLHYHGGYGFMMEYDVQLHYRRARAWAGVFGEPAAAYRRAADHRYGPAAAVG